MNAFISSSLGSSIMYFCTKIFGSNPAVAYLTNVSPFSVQSRIPIADYHPLHHFRFEEVSKIHIQLRSILMAEFVYLQFHNDTTFQDAVIEYTRSAKK